MRKLIPALLTSLLLCFSAAHAAEDPGLPEALQNIHTRINCGDHETVLKPEHFKRLAYSINRLKTRNDDLTNVTTELVRLNQDWVNAVIGCIKEDTASCSNLATLPQQIYQVETSINRMVAVQHQLRMQIFGAPSRVAMRACAERPAAAQ